MRAALGVNRELLRIIRDANDSVARFKEVLPVADAAKDKPKAAAADDGKTPVDASGELVDSAFENSPDRMLPKNALDKYSPMLGYYEADRVRSFDQKLRAIPPATVDKWENDPGGEAIGTVVYALRATFAEAAKRKYAVAVEHR